MRGKTSSKTRVMKNDQAQVLPAMDVLEWPIGLGCDGDGYPAIYCEADEDITHHRFVSPSTPRELLTQIAIHAKECKGVDHE